MTSKKYWLFVIRRLIMNACFLAIGFMLAKYYVTQKYAIAFEECTQLLEEEDKMIKTWCTDKRVRIGQCPDSVHVCICSTPDDYGQMTE